MNANALGLLQTFCIPLILLGSPLLVAQDAYGQDETQLADAILNRLYSDSLTIELQVGPNLAIPILIEIAVSPRHDAIRAKVVHTLVGLTHADTRDGKSEHTPEIVFALIRVLTMNTTQETRLAAISGLSRLSSVSEVVVPALLHCLRPGEDAEIDDFAFWTLVRLETDPTPYFVRILDSGREPDLRKKAAYALGRIRPTTETHLTALIRALDDKHATVRFGACEGLRVLGPHADAAVPKLLELTRDEDPNVRTMAESALQKIDPLSPSPLLDRLR